MRLAAITLILIGCVGSVETVASDELKPDSGDDSDSNEDIGDVDGGVVGKACFDRQPPWTCRPWDYRPTCDVMPSPCGLDSCPDDVGRCPQKECIGWFVNMKTGECEAGELFGGPRMCGPSNTWGCQTTPDYWACCVENGF